MEPEEDCAIQDPPSIGSCIILRSAFDGQVLAEFSFTDAVDVYYVGDLLDVLCSRRGPLSARERLLVDIIEAASGMVLQWHEELVYSGEVQEYLVLMRPCPRCTLCDKACTRTGPHQLCSHGGTEHLWHFAPPGERCTVQGYYEECNLVARSGFSVAQIEFDLSDLREPASLHP